MTKQSETVFISSTMSGALRLFLIEDPKESTSRWTDFLIDLTSLGTATRAFSVSSPIIGEYWFTERVDAPFSIQRPHFDTLFLHQNKHSFGLIAENEDWLIRSGYDHRAFVAYRHVDDLKRLVKQHGFVILREDNFVYTKHMTDLLDPLYAVLEFHGTGSKDQELLRIAD
jgi:hypothetical protein